MSVTLTWPAELDPPERETWGIGWNDARDHRRGDYGPPRFGGRVSATSRPVQMSLVCTAMQRAVFNRFFVDDTKKGKLLFWMPDPTRDGWPLATPTGAALLTPTGTPLLISARWLCVFGADGLPQESIVDQVRFRMSFALEVLPT